MSWSLVVFLELFYNIRLDKVGCQQKYYQISMRNDLDTQQLVQSETLYNSLECSDQKKISSENEILYR